MNEKRYQSSNSPFPLEICNVLFETLSTKTKLVGA